VNFEIISDVKDIEVIAIGNGIRDIARLRKYYGKGRWRKLKGIATVKINKRDVLIAEIHWYEAHGIGKKEFKIKRFI
jgi:hypothetical protein